MYNYYEELVLVPHEVPTRPHHPKLLALFFIFRVLITV